MKSGLLFAKCFLLGAFCFLLNNAQGQGFSKLYDTDSLVEFGISLGLTSDSNFLVIDGGINAETFQHDFATLVVSQNGNVVLNKNHYRYGDVSIYTIGIPGGYGRLHEFRTNEFLTPYNKSYTSITPRASFTMGFMRLDANGDSIQSMFFTDTSVFNEQTTDVSYSSVNGRYILVGQRVPVPPHDSFGYGTGVLVVADTLGNVLVRKEFEKKAPIPPLPPNGVLSRINSVEALPDGRILIGAANGNLDSKYGPVGPVHLDYYHMRPWFIITDQSGNILKDTMYDGHFAGQGNVYTDKFGGFLHWGTLDSFAHTNPLDFRNLPGYVARLDSNFRPVWLHVFLDTLHRSFVIKTVQLKNGDYLAIGTYMNSDGWQGWASRLDRSGLVKWDRHYTVDSTTNPYLVDAVEHVGGHVALVGMARNSNNPAWRQQDVWLLNIDSNGCELPNCSGASTSVPEKTKGFVSMISAYPNPSTGLLNIESKYEGSLTLFNVQGARVITFAIQAGMTSLKFPAFISPGVYFGRFTSQKDKSSEVLRITYQP